MKRNSIFLNWCLCACVVAGLSENAVAARFQAASGVIADLIDCYARGTDAIGDANTNADPEAAGRAIYEQCFTPDAEFNVWFPHQPFDAQKFPDKGVLPPTPPSPVIGPAAWAAFVNSVFRANGYDFTQHMMSNIDVQRQGREARLTAYVSASHVVSGEGVGGISKCVAVANGTYSLHIARKRGRWWITRLDLTLISFNPVFGCED